MKIVSVPLSEVQPDPRNPRVHDERNLEAIRASLIAHGQVEPILLQASTRRIIAGHGRVEVMRQLGFDDVDAVLLDVNDADATRIGLRLNRSPELATWNTDVLADVLRDLGETADLGWSDDELSTLLADVSDGTGFLEQFAAESTAPRERREPAPAPEADAFVDFVVPITVEERAEIGRVISAAKKQLGVASTREVLLAVFRAYRIEEN